MLNCKFVECTSNIHQMYGQIKATQPNLKLCQNYLTRGAAPLDPHSYGRGTKVPSEMAGYVLFDSAQSCLRKVPNSNLKVFQPVTTTVK